MKERNFGLDGVCNSTILSTLLSQLENIQPGDKVIVGNTSPLRDLIPNKDGTKLIDQKLFDSTPYTSSIAHRNEKLEKILREYCIEFKSNYLHLWNNWSNRQFLNVFKFLNRLDVKTLLWDYSVWSEEEQPGMKFENILTHTNGKIYDLHWSFNGHLEAYKWISKGLDMNKKFLKV